MNANDLTFGIEIETIVNCNNARNNGLNIGGYHNGTQVSYLPEGWTAARDGSLSGTANETGCEIVSPILRGKEGLRQIHNVLAILKEKGHRVNKTCGVHIHIGYGAQPEVQIRRLIAVVSYLETAIYATTGTKNRERGTYCKGIRRHENVQKAVENMNYDRYHLLNITNLRRGRIPTVEFRAFSGSLNPVKILGWVQACLGAVERGLTTKRLPVWKSKTAVGGWRKNGVGQTDVERFYAENVVMCDYCFLSL